ncbi:putative membrane protein YkoI [Catenibacillus scindens]|uniref:Putative membrane protein YkoI n=1 Tax=Catenibacillus scindens TaxID=673271 RepID=A0A7W8H9F2_9FIRM|nr:PepSY domain-containing protein [Catenibacillus scindens]MBB5263592.1 putative membrane protein YkoI [Catenibacillus scindens]
MKKKNLLLTTVTVIGILAAVGCGSPAPSSSEDTTAQSTVAPNYETSKQTSVPASSGTTSGTGVTEEQAKATALADAGVNEADVTRIRVRKDRDDGRNIYEVEFYVEREEYDYDIDADSGQIVSKDFDIDDDFHNNSGSATTQNSDVISEDQAIQIVLERVEGASASDVWIKLDYDDGRTYYEGEIYYNNTEYEFEMDAYTGEILEWSEESYRG